MHARWLFGWVVRFALLFVVYMVCFAIGGSLVASVLPDSAAQSLDWCRLRSAC
jgi:hypothetical protein